MNFRLIKVFGSWRGLFTSCCKEKAEIPEGSLNDYGIPKAWGLEQFGILKAGGRGLSILEFWKPSGRGEV